MPNNPAPSFSGHETFALRASWLKKAFDHLAHDPALFTREDAFVQLGVGKNMAQSIKYWGRVSGVFARNANGDLSVTRLGQRLLSDEGWDPYLVSAAGRWLVHWQIASRPEAAFSWFFAFNLLRAGEFSTISLAEQIHAYATEQVWKVPALGTLVRDVECLLHTYVPPDQRRLAAGVEDALACPLTSLGLIRVLPGQRRYYLASSAQPSLPDALVAWAILSFLRQHGERTIAFNDLAYAPGSPGRVFRLDEDGLLGRLLLLDRLTAGALVYNDQAGIRQVYWTGQPDQVEQLADQLLERTFEEAV